MAQSVALVFPPLWDTLDAAPLGPAVLAGALRDAALHCDFFDVNVDFYAWLLSDESISQLIAAASAADATDEQAQLERLRTFPEVERSVMPERLAAVFALCTSLGMSERLLLGPHRYLAGIQSSEICLAELVSSKPKGAIAAFWHDWMGARAQHIAEHQPDLVAMTISHVGQLLPAAALAHGLRSLYPNVPILAGGAYCTTMATSDANFSPMFAAFDGIGVGPGEDVIVSAARSSRSLPRNEAGLWVAGTACPPLGRPAPSSPDYSVVALGQYARKGQHPTWVSLESSRGCWARCRYCNYTQLNSGYRTKPIEQVALEVRDLQTRVPGTLVSFVDDTIAPKRALQLAAAFAQLAVEFGQLIEWEGCLRPDARLNAEQCRELRSGGMRRVFIGFDAATERMLKEIDKRATLDELRVLVGNLRAADIVVSGNFIVGLPGEAESDRRAVLDLVEELGLDRSQVTASLFGLVRGSWYYAHADEMGWPKEWVARVKANDVLTDFLPTPRCER